MSLVVIVKEIDNVMEPFNTKMQQMVAIDEKKKKHSEATKKGLAPWLIYRNIWLKRLEEFPDIYPSYNEKIKHIAGMWRICKASIASRQMEKLNRNKE